MNRPEETLIQRLSDSWRTTKPEETLMKIFMSKFPAIVNMGPWEYLLHPWATLDLFTPETLEKYAMATFNRIHHSSRFLPADDSNWKTTIRDNYTPYYVDSCALLLRLLIMIEFKRHTCSYLNYFKSKDEILERAHQLDKLCRSAAIKYRQHPKKLFDIYYQVVTGKYGSLRR